MTLLVAALTGGATVGVALAAVGMRRARAQLPRRDQGPRAPGPRPARPGQPPTRTGPKPPPPAWPHPRGLPATHRPPASPTEALGGETLQLGPVPAWQLPVHSPAPGVRGLFSRRRGEYTSAAAMRVVDEETGPDPQGTRNDRDVRGAPSVVTNASRRHDPRTATGRTPGR